MSRTLPLALMLFSVGAVGCPGGTPPTDSPALCTQLDPEVWRTSCESEDPPWPRGEDPCPGFWERPPLDQEPVPTGNPRTSDGLAMLTPEPDVDHLSVVAVTEWRPDYEDDYGPCDDEAFGDDDDATEGPAASTTVVATWGSPCSGATDGAACTAAFDALPLTNGFDSSMTWSTCMLTRYVLRTTRGDAASIVGNTADLVSALGPLDSAADAGLFLLFDRRLQRSALYTEGAGWAWVGYDAISSDPIVDIRWLTHMDQQGNITEDEPSLHDVWCGGVIGR